MIMFEVLIYIFDIIGTAIFAITGAVSAVKLRLDMLGVAAFAVTVGVGGGILRDTMIGATPVAALQDEVYLIVCVAFALLIFFLSHHIANHRKVIMICDAFGLGVFTAIGAAKGVHYGLGPAGTILCGMLSAVGGGILRDVMARKIPAVLVSDFYATASLIGGGTFILLSKTGLSYPVIIFSVAAIVILIRLLAIHFNLQLPRSRKKILE